jgi:N-acetylneuraminate lyase
MAGAAGTLAASAARAEKPAGGAKLPLPAGKIFEGMSGAWAAMYTPFYRTGAKAGELNEEMIERVVEYHVAKGLTGEYLTGSTGEGYLLSADERERVYRRVVKAAGGRLKVIAHVGCLATRDACDLARRAAAAGVDWVSSTAPVYYGQSFDMAYEHYRQISEATDLPFMVYSIGAKLVPDQAVRFFDLKNVHGMKYTGRDFYDFGAMCRKLSKPAIFFSGADEHTLNGFATGRFSGCIGTTDNQLPDQFVKICGLAAANDFAGAARYQENVCRFIDHLFSIKGFGKSMMRYIGLDCGNRRYPAEKPVTEAEYAVIVKVANGLGFIRENDAALLGI